MDADKVNQDQQAAEKERSLPLSQRKSILPESVHRDSSDDIKSSTSNPYTSLSQKKNSNDLLTQARQHLSVDKVTVLDVYHRDTYIQGRRRGGARGGKHPSCPLLRRARRAKVPFS